MREIRLYGSEGGEADTISLSYPYPLSAFAEQIQDLKRQLASPIVEQPSSRHVIYRRCGRDLGRHLLAPIGLKPQWRDAATRTGRLENPPHAAWDHISL